MQALALSNNDLSGPIPTELGGLANLLRLELQRNALTGSIPPELGNLTALTRLLLWRNALTGPIPPELADLAALATLDLGTNALTGPIPPELGNLTALEKLNLPANALTGPVPPELGNLANLRTLGLYENALTGPIPPELGNIPWLGQLWLDGNALTGPIPPELGKLDRLWWLDLSKNGLTGPVPPELGNVSELHRLELSGNKGLSGPLPLTLTTLRWLHTLVAVDTGLCAPEDLGFRRWATRLRTYRVRQCFSGVAPYYLVQASQSRDFPVPLVSGRDALLRVFPTAPPGEQIAVPSVRALFFSSGGASPVYDVTIPGKPGPLPAEIAEGDLAVSANVEIPGSVVRPGLEMVVEIDPSGTLDPALGIGGRFPAEGRTALEIYDLRAMDLTLVPFLWTHDPDSSVIAPVREMAADPMGHYLLRLPRAVLPAHDWIVTAHEPVWTDIPSSHLHELLTLVEAIRKMEGGQGHWMGTGRGVSGGLAILPGATSVSSLDPRIMAHELGHNLSLLHAPCAAPSPDPAFPDANGRSGVWGYDFANDELISPDAPDIMGYCWDSPWISDYSYGRALRYRVPLFLSLAEPTNTPVPTLLLWGGTDDTGAPYLRPSFVVNAPSALPDRDGPWTLEGRDGSGRTLFSLPFAMPEIADAGEGAGAFAYTLPVRSGWETLASITLSGPAGTATLDGSTDNPMAIYRDGRGKVRAILHGDPVQADGAPGGLAGGVALDVVTSRGLPSRDAWRW